ncbi:MAG: leucine-rich repeat protein [Kiritimatiellae bacterium]|nr:leucine-rich repeat protein [Kiritimatiellia bacterium]
MPTGAVAIPDALGGKPVTSIGDFAFYNCTNLTSVTIPDSVTSIGEDAFDGCSGLLSFVVSDNNDNYAAANGLLLSKDKRTLIKGVNGDVVIPDSVTSIGDYAFLGCNGLTSVTIPVSVTSIGVCAFSGCGGLTSVTIPVSVTSIGDYAFLGCNGLTSVTIPASVTSIGDSAFDGCITDAVLPGRQCGVPGGSLTNLIITADVADTFLDESYVNHFAFDGLDSLESLTFLNGVKSIGKYSFPECAKLKSVTFSNSVTNIGDWAFRDCHVLTRVEIPDSVTSICEGAFFQCTSLEDVRIPNGVTSIGDNAFDTCRSLTNVTFSNSVTNIGKGAFFQCRSLTKLVIPNSAISIGSNAFACCWGLEEAYVPKRFLPLFNSERQFQPAGLKIFYYDDFAEILNEQLTADDGGEKSIEILSTNACRVAFEWKCSCEPMRKGKMRDFLSFSVDGVQLDAICGETGWTNMEFFVEGAGEHILRWTYQKDDSGTEGEDCGWIRLATVAPRVTLSFLSGGATAGMPPEAMSFYADAGQVELPGRGALAWPKHTFLGWSDGETIWTEGAMYPCNAAVLGLTAAWARNELAAPVIDAPSEFYEDSTEIAIAAEAGTTIYYTLDNSAPTAESLLYSGTVTIDATTTIRAIAVKDDCFDSPEAVMIVTKESITAGEAVNAAGLEFATDSETGWRCVKGESPDGYALRSGVIGHNATSRVETVVLGPGQIAFSCKVAGEVVKGEVYDGLAFLIDGVQRGELMGNTEWTTNTFEVVGEGEHVLSWLYIKDESDEEVLPDDCAWLDEVKWTSNGGSVEPGPTMVTVVFDANGGEMNAVESLRQVETNTVVGELPVPCRSDHAFLGWFTAADGGEEVSAEVVVTSDITFYAHWQCRFSFDGGSGWTQQTDGSWKSNPTADGETNSLSMTVSGSGTIAFRWKTNCEGYFNFKGMSIRQDGISLIVDGEERAFTNGVMSAWAECSLAVEGDGNHDLAWAYIKDSSGFEGTDCAWLDSVVWTPNAPAGIVIKANGAAVEFETAANGKTRTAEVMAGTAAEDVKVFVGGVDVTAGFKVAVEGTTATVVLKKPYEAARSEIAPYQAWTDNGDGNVTLNVEVVPGLYYAADSAATIEALRRPGVAEPAKAGDAVVAPKQTGTQGFYKVWVSDAPIKAE